jgi:hypothetical protein
VLFAVCEQGAACWAQLAPLARLQQQLASCISVADLLLMKLRGCVGDKAVMTEMQVRLIAMYYIVSVNWPMTCCIP